MSASRMTGVGYARRIGFRGVGSRISVLSFVDSILGELPEELATVLVHPTAPTATTPVTVTDLTEFNAAAAVDGNLITVDGNIVGTAVIQASDIEVVGLPGYGQFCFQHSWVLR